MAKLCLLGGFSWATLSDEGFPERPSSSRSVNFARSHDSDEGSLIDFDVVVVDVVDAEVLAAVEPVSRLRESPFLLLRPGTCLNSKA